MENIARLSQGQRLTQFLDGLLELSRECQLLLHLDEPTGDIEIVDLRSRTVLGIGLIPQLSTDETTVSVYDCEGSILDGVWLVEHDGQMVEQRTIPHRKEQP